MVAFSRRVSYARDVQLPKIVHNVRAASTRNKLRGFQQPRLLTPMGKQNNTGV